ncbi:MAG: hypothetical protein GY696_36635 [Gammaproteobacteria bacterium]|nr:hypothetical protein [Gammaproteobacteria bacterium]
MFKVTVIGDDEGDENPQDVAMDRSPSFLNASNDLNVENDLNDLNGEGII